MQLTELHPDLRTEYSHSTGQGVEKINHPKCQNMWFVVPPSPPRHSPIKTPENLSVKVLSVATDILNRQPNLKDATELDRLVSYLFVRKEAVESSRMEGTLSTIDHVLTPGDLFDDWKTKTEGASVRGYAHSLETELLQVQEKGLAIFTTDLVTRLHNGTMSLDPRFKGVPGRLREPNKPGETVWIRGHSPMPEDSIYNPPPARHVLRCLKETLAWYADQELFEFGNAGIGMPLVSRMAIGHSHFEGIHPFSDGNGRVGRMLLALQIAAQGKLPLYLSGYIEETKQQYSNVLQEAQKQLNYTPLIEYFCHAVIASFNEEAQTRKCLESLPTQWVSRGKIRKGSTAQRALQWLIAHPIFITKQIKEQFSVSTQAAHTAVEILQKNKIIRERTGFERNRVFAAEEVISLLSRKFGSDPEEALEGAQLILN